MKYKLKSHHYDMVPGTFWYSIGPTVPHPGGSESVLVTEIEGDTTEGSSRVVPINKLEPA